MTARDSPVATLVNAILLSSIKKRASRIRVYLSEQGVAIVDYVIDERLVPEMRPPPELHGPLVRRLGVMASLPVYAKDESASGRVELQIGEQPQRAYFDVTIRGHGSTLRADVAVHGLHARPPPFTPPGVDVTGRAIR